MACKAVAAALPGDYWVEAELLSIRETHGNCYMELVQKDMLSSDLLAQASARCWQTRWREVSRNFIQATGDWPIVGMKLLLHVTIQFHARYGYALIVNDIDPAYTLGEIALKRQEVIQKLKDEGVYELQHGLTLPLFAQRIAVISSDTAAGYGDFCNQLMSNNYGFAFKVTLFASVMQGERVSQSVISQLEEIYRRIEEFDCVVIIRGGGATSDMNAFDALDVAENVANFPLPVVTGIGHDRDECVLDLIAYYKAKTPTAAADFLVEHLEAVWQRVEAAQETIKREALQYCTQRKGELQLLSLRLDNAVKALFERKNHELDLLSQRINGLDPMLLLHRGYTMTLRDGRLVKQASALEAGQELETVFEDGRVKSIIV